MTARTIFLHLRRRSRTIYTQLRLAGRMLRGTPNPYLEQPTSEAPEFDWSKKFEDIECAVCTDHIYQGTDFAIIEGCMHMFCRPCLKEWLNVKRTCPLCVQPVKGYFHTRLDLPDTLPVRRPS